MPDWYDNNWLYRKKITIDHTKIDATLTDFPLTVFLSASNFDFTKARSDGYDIRFTSDDEITLLKYERDRHDDVNELAEYHVKVPSISSSVDTDIYIYYGYASASDGADPTNVWDTNFKGIWHLKEVGNGTADEYKDSTAGVHHGTGDSGAYPAQVDAVIGKGQNTTGNKRLTVAHHSDLNLNNLTMECWINQNANPTQAQQILAKHKSSFSACYNFWYSISAPFNFEFTVNIGGSRKICKSTVLPTNGVWYHILGTYDGINLKIYIDGELDNTVAQTGTVATSTNPLYFAKVADGNSNGNFKMDEVRVSNTVRLAEYAKASYNSGNNTLNTFDIEQNQTDILETDSFGLSDEIFLNVSLEKQIEEDSFSLTDEIELILYETYDLVNDFRMAKAVLTNVNNKVNTCIRVFSNIVNVILIAKNSIINIANDIRSKRQEFYNINNDIRTLLDFQIAGDAGFQSLGKEYIKVYINSIEQTSVDVDTISITKSLNASHTANLELGLAYDTSLPFIIGDNVEIKYHIWTLYTGYISQIAPTDNPESIHINCQDEYWKRNQGEKKYFVVGHQPKDNKEVYYSTIAEGLSICNANFGIGNFIPQTIDLFGSPESDAITNLISQAGNYAWYYDNQSNKKLWIAGQGDIININPQELGTNLGLYQLLSHSIKEDIENIVNKYRVQMGERVIKRFNNQGGTKQFASYQYKFTRDYAQPDWDSQFQINAKDSPIGYGYDYHDPKDDKLYADIYKRYRLPFLNKELENWTDRYDPEVRIYLPFGGLWKCNIPIETVNRFGFTESQPLKEGFTIDYENRLLIFNSPIWIFQTNKFGEETERQAPSVTLYLWKKNYYSDTNDQSQNPTSDIANPLMFFTEQMGDYPDTILDNFYLTNLGIQFGGWYRDNDNIFHLVPSWDDTLFAKDYANWQLSQHCDKQITGSIEITLDAFCYFGIELNKRIMINNILIASLNITNITLNVSSFTATIQLRNNRYYSRTVSLQSRGE